MENKEEQELVLHFYESARQEILLRIGMRETSMMSYLGAVAALIAGAIAEKEHLLLLIIPFLTLAISLITLHHNLYIGGLIKYCGSELDSYFRKKTKVSHWDTSKTRINLSEQTKAKRLWGDMVLIITPSLLGFVMNYKILSTVNLLFILFLSGIICVIISMILIYKTKKSRDEVLCHNK
jgi:hypothetical protein